MTRRGRPESDHERGQIVPFYAGLGFDVYATSARVWAKGVTPGVADLLIYSDKLQLHFVHETKLAPNRQSVGQLQYEKNCIACGIPYVLGDIEDAMNFVCWLGLADRVGPTVRVKPRDQWPLSVTVLFGGNRLRQHTLAEHYARSDFAKAAREKYGFRRVA